MEVVTVRFPIWVLKTIDGLVAKGFYQSRSDFIRDAVKKHLKKFRKLVDSPSVRQLLEGE